MRPLSSSARRSRSTFCSGSEEEAKERSGARTDLRPIVDAGRADEEAAAMVGVGRTTVANAKAIGPRRRSIVLETEARTAGPEGDFAPALPLPPEGSTTRPGLNSSRTASYEGCMARFRSGSAELFARLRGLNQEALEGRLALTRSRETA
jgi:hypothetical protein